MFGSVVLIKPKTITHPSTAAGATFPRNRKLDFGNKCLIHISKCKLCKKQYVGEKSDAFQLSWNNCKDNDRKFQKIKTMSDFPPTRLIGNTDGFLPKKRENTEWEPRNPNASGTPC